MNTIPIHNGDHAEFEIENANTKPQDRSDWPYPSFDARDWAKAFCKIAGELGLSDKAGKPIDEEWMITWFSSSLMRGWDEHGSRTNSERDALLSSVRKLVGEWKRDSALISPNPTLMSECADQLESLLAQHPEASPNPAPEEG